MQLRNLRLRMLAVALVPLSVVVLVVVGLMWSARAGDLQEAHRERGRLLIDQLAHASEYGLFSANLDSLEGIARAVLREPQVASAAIFDNQGTALVAIGLPPGITWAQVQSRTYQEQRERANISLFTDQVVATEVAGAQDIYAPAEGARPTAPLLGYVLVEVSRESLSRGEVEAMWSAIGVALIGAGVGGGMATWLSRRVMRPIARLSSQIERIGRGDFRPPALQTDDPLVSLQRQLSDMASKLGAGREELEQQVARATQEITVQRDEAQRANRAKSLFLAAASHDLRQPTHALGMFVARLEHLALQPQAAEVVQYLGASVHSMQNLLDSLLDISRLESGTVRAHLQPTALQPLLDELTAAQQPMAQERGLRLRVRPSDDWVQTDAALLRSILMNLLQNAIRYTREGTVLVSCRPEQGGAAVRLDVSDSGIGIAAELHQAIFAEFFQAGNPGRERDKGLGLGLSIVQRTAALLGHDIRLRSAPGCGSRFSVVMRRAPVNSLSVNAEALAPAVGSLNGLRVLVVEDDPLARTALVTLLQAWDCDVSPAASLTEALAVLERMRPTGLPEFLISDYRLGKESNGIQLIAALRHACGREVPACLISGDTDPALLRKVDTSGLLLLHKPVRPAKLRAMLRRLRT